MDYKRIQVLLIVFFLVFDIYLVYQLLAQVDFGRENVANNQDLVKIEERLDSRGITLYQELSTDTESLPLIKADYNTVLQDNAGQLVNQITSVSENGILESTFAETIDLEGLIASDTAGLSLEQASYLMENYLSQDEYFINGDEYRQWWYVPSTRTIIFWMTAYDGAPIVDGSAEIRISLDEDYNMQSYRQTYVTDLVAIEEDEPFDLISQENSLEVLDNRLQTFIPSNAYIVHITLSYAQYTSLNDYQIYSPVWNVVYSYSDGQVGSMLVDAIRGEVLVRRSNGS
ncbi:two-component system regulatory protein YycI [Fundicoccus culcitae]|uniref:Two-component system regulatory protein YycI n=1 Tax=Fundicoccus culcitae TaxID=2969821 RepID=A0ABY5P3J4_9LACT|nr:two-component system regulatory protein YycI [Fundicoccus culcitae]UUX33237.1 two-component system regulatory protein YycI [Fundicoccus culcitae]